MRIIAGTVAGATTVGTVVIAALLVDLDESAGGEEGDDRPVLVPQPGRRVLPRLAARPGVGPVRRVTIPPSGDDAKVRPVRIELNR